jgi:hypothetical protein
MITWGHGMASTHAGGLIAELSRRASQEGGNTGAWPGLTIYRFTSPVGPAWEEIQFVSALDQELAGAVLRFLRSPQPIRVRAPLPGDHRPVALPIREGDTSRQGSRAADRRPADRRPRRAGGRVRQRVPLHQRVPRPIRRHAAYLQRRARAAPRASRPTRRPDRYAGRPACFNSAGPPHYLAGTWYAKWNGQ